MISFQRLLIDASDGRFDALIDDALRDGPRVPLPVRLRLSDPEHADLTGLSLALVQMCRTTGQIGPRARVLLGRLLSHLDGMHVSLAPGAAAVVANALLTVREHLGVRPSDAPLPTAERRALEHWIGEMVHTLFLAQQAAWSAGEPGLMGDPLDSVIVAWQLSHHADSIPELRIADLGRALQSPEVRHTPGVDELLHRTRLALPHAA